MARRRAVRDHRHRLAGGVGRVHRDLHVEHGGQAAQALRADAQRVDLVAQLDAQLLESCSAGRAACSSYMSMSSISASLAISIAFSAVPPMPMPSMPGGHQPAPIVGTVFSTQSTRRVARVEHHELALVLAAAALGRDLHVDGVAGHQLHVHHGRRVVLGVLALELRVGDDRRAQHVVGVEVAAAHAFVDGVLDAAGEALEAHVHADLQEHVDDAGVLADRPPAFGAHLRVGQDLRDRVLGRRALLALVGARQVGDVVGRVVVADVLQRGGDRSRRGRRGGSWWSWRCSGAPMFGDE